MMGAMHAEVRAAKAQRQAARANRKSTDVSSDMHDIEDRLDKLVMISQAMWELLRDNTSLEESDLFNKIQEIDLRDGVEDGRVTPTVQKCRDCGRVMHPRHNKCLYCGREKLHEQAFDAVR